MIPNNLNESLKKLDFKRKQWQINIEVVLVLSLLFQIYLIFNYWNDLADTIPTHFNLQGEADGYGGKSTLIIFPIVSFFLYLLMSLAHRFPQMINVPWTFTEENLERQIKLVFTFLLFLKSEIIFMMTFFCYQSIEIALGNAQSLGYTPLVLVGGIFATIIWYFKKGYSIR